MRRSLLVLAAVAGLAAAVVPALAADGSIAVSDNAFTPDTVTVAPGEAVTISSPGTANSHDVHWDDRSSAENLPTTAPFTVTRTFPVAGTFTFACDVHRSSGMTGSVRVVDPGATTTTGTTTTTTTTTTSGTTTSTYGSPAPTGATTTTAVPSGALTLRARVVRATRRGGLVVRLSLGVGATVRAKLRHGATRRSVRFAAPAGTVRRVLVGHPAPGRWLVEIAAADGAARRAGPVRLTVRVR